MLKSSLLLLTLLGTTALLGQSAPPSTAPPHTGDTPDVIETVPANPGPGKQVKTPPVSNDESSSKNIHVDLMPPSNDVREHPEDDPNLDTREMHPWNPMRAMKAIEIGDFYFKQGNMRGAISRYREALYFKDKDATASLRLAQALEKNHELYEARKYYQQYLDVLPQGKDAPLARKALERIPRDVKPSGDEPDIENFHP